MKLVMKFILLSVLTLIFQSPAKAASGITCMVKEFVLSEAGEKRETFTFSSQTSRSGLELASQASRLNPNISYQAAYSAQDSVMNASATLTTGTSRISSASSRNTEKPGDYILVELSVNPDTESLKYYSTFAMSCILDGTN